MNCLSPLRSRAVRAFRRFAADETGATAVEYGLMVALISIATLAALFAIGEGIKVTLNSILTALADIF